MVGSSNSEKRVIPLTIKKVKGGIPKERGRKEVFVLGESVSGKKGKRGTYPSKGEALSSQREDTAS